MNFVFEDVNTCENLITCDDMHSSGMKRYSSSPVISTLLRTQTYKNVSNNPADFNSYIIPVGVNQSNIDWCGPTKKFLIGFNIDLPDRKILFSYINPQYLADLRSGKAFLLLDQTHEGYHEDWLNKWFHSSCEEFDINPRQIIYITGNLDVANQYASWANTNKIVDRVLMVPFSHFEQCIYNAARKKILPNFDQHLKYKTTNLDKIKDYNFLQKRPRAHRMWLFKEVCQAGLLDYGINSMNVFSRSDTYYFGKSMNELDYNEIIKHLPMLPPNIPNTKENLDEFANQDSGKYPDELNLDIILNSWVSVVSEASFGENTCFISEKTFKPIACKHPFIIAGNKLSLHYLKEMGYKTFSPYIDETYDTLECWERMPAIIQEIKKIQMMTPNQKIDWFQGMKEILEYNANVFRTNSLNKISPPILKIDNYFNNIK